MNLDASTTYNPSFKVMEKKWNCFKMNSEHPSYFYGVVSTQAISYSFK